MEQLVVSLNDLTEELNKLYMLRKFLDTIPYIDIKVNAIMSYESWTIDNNSISLVVKLRNKVFSLPIDRGHVELTKDFIKFYEECKQEKPLLVDRFSVYLKNSLEVSKSTKSYGFLI